jgi:hypothetical protein
VVVGPFSVRWLKCSFHFSPLLKKYKQLIYPICRFRQGKPRVFDWYSRLGPDVCQLPAARGGNVIPGFEPKSGLNRSVHIPQYRRAGSECSEVILPQARNGRTAAGPALRLCRSPSAAHSRRILKMMYFQRINFLKVTNPLDMHEGGVNCLQKFVTCH